MNSAAMSCIVFILAASANAAGQIAPEKVDHAVEAFQEGHRFLFEFGKGRAIVNAIDALVPSIKEQLAWSAEKGALLLVRMRRDTFHHQPAQLADVEQLGFGPTPYEVLVLSIEKPPPAVPDFDPDSSFFVWIERHGKDVKKLYLPPGSFESLVDRARADEATRSLLHQMQPLQEYKNLLAMATEGMRRTGDAQARKALRDAYRDMVQSRQEQEQVDRELAQALDEQRRIAGATAWLNGLDQALAVATLATQVQAMLGPDAPPSVKTDIKNALTTEELKTAVKTYETDQAAKVYTYGKKKTAVDLLYNKRERYIIDTVKTKAPSAHLP